MQDKKDGTCGTHGRDKTCIARDTQLRCDGNIMMDLKEMGCGLDMSASGMGARAVTMQWTSGFKNQRDELTSWVSATQKGIFVNQLVL
jgi:hypothetical protein